MNQPDSASNPLREILDSYYRAWFRYHPEAAVDCGVDGYAHLLTPCDETSAGALVCLNDELLVALEEFEGSVLSVDEALDVLLVRSAAGLENERLLNVDPQRGLNGVGDFIITRSPEQFFISAPVIVVVEAKNENIKGGLGQCIATMLAARLFKTQEAQPISTVYGAVTSGSVWKFLQLIDSTVYIDLEEYHINNAGKILGILMHMVEGAYATLPA